MSVLEASAVLNEALQWGGLIMGVYLVLMIRSVTRL